jgi:two-component system sensor histidine kinase RegB
MTPEDHDPSAAAMGLDDQRRDRPWYLGATPLATLPWLIRLRWTTASIELALVAVTFALPTVAMWLTRGRALGPTASAVVLGIEILLLTGLLEITGGPSNPFAVVYALQLTLAALTLGTLWTVFLGAFAAASYGVLIYWHVHELVPGHHRLNDFPTHLFTIWIAGAVAVELAAYFVVQVSDALVKRERELETMRGLAAHAEKLVSLTTLAAGAAHELSTPLATIALAARELERTLGARGGVADLTEDARLIRSEVDRCQVILDQMSGRAGGSATDEAELVAIPDVVAEVRCRLAPELANRLEVHAPSAPVLAWVPRAGLAQALVSLIKNAFDATGNSDTPVLVDVSEAAGRFRVSVRDRGTGLTPEGLRRAGEPFYTTKEPGHGLGLGLFLARMFAERLGGTLKLETGAGTCAMLELPSRSDIARSA